MNEPNGNSDVESPRKRGCGCYLYGLLFCIGVPLLLLIIGLLTLVARESAARSELQNQTEALGAAGMPVDDASMQAYFESLTSDENTETWLQIIATVTSEEFASSTSGVPVFDGTIETEVPTKIATDSDARDSTEKVWAEEDATREFLNRWNDLHNQIMRAGLNQLREDVKPVRFPIQFSSLNTLLRNTQELRTAARLLSLRGQVAVLDRDSSAARRSIESLLGTAEVLAGEPVLVSQLVRVAIDGMALAVLKSAIENDVLKEADLTRLMKPVLARTNLGPHWKMAMQGERAMMLPVFQNPSLARQNRTPSLPARSRDALNYLSIIEEVLAIKTDNLDEFRQELAAIDAKIQNNTAGGILSQFDNILTSLLAPAMSSVGDAFVRQATTHRLAALSIGIRVFEKRNGRLPNDLKELESLEDLAAMGFVPAALIPPGGQPFGYLTDAAGGTIWGFDLQSAQSVPALPPTIEDGDPYADSIRLWIWELTNQAKETDN